MKYLVVLSCMLLLSGASAREITLEEALRLAEEHSHGLKATRANREAADQTVRAARAERFPTLSLDARAGYLSEIPSLDLSLPGLPSLSRDFGSNDSYQTDLRLSVPLYTGGRLGSAVRQAESGRAYREALDLVERDNLFLATRLEFLHLYQTHRLLEAAASSEKRIEILRDGVIARLEAGVADSVDLLDVRSAAARADSRASQAESAVRSAEIMLWSRLGQRREKRVVPVISLEDPDQRLMKVAPWSDSIPRLRAASALVSREEATLNSRRAAFYPTLGVYTGYSYGKPNIDPFSDKFNDSYTFGAQLNWSFGLGGEQSARRNSAALTLEAARRQHDQVEESINCEIRLALEQCQMSVELFVTAKEERDLARENFRLAQAQHENGSLTSNRLLEIEQSLTEAEARLAAARVDFYIAQSVYFYAAGDERLRKGL